MLTKNVTRPIEILLVEDDPDHAETTMETLGEGRFNNRVQWVQDGEEALAVLRQEGSYTSAVRPDLILLDLNMPRMNGLEVLSEVKTHPEWKHIPVIIMTASTSEEHVLSAYDRHANCYINKAMGLDGITETVRSIEDFWMGLVRLPAA